MYAVIRTGGKQYRVAPGDVLRIEKAGAAANETIEFSEVLAASTSEGALDKPQSAKVTATVLGDGRGDKILVFHYKRKKQYKKLQGHRQAYTSVRINEIEVDHLPARKVNGEVDIAGATGKDSEDLRWHTKKV
jgi:large subunit ribosomal protein L21